jgi:hypothetical protein
MMRDPLEWVKQALAKPSPVSLVTAGDDGPHLIGVWNDDVIFHDDHTLFLPVMGMRKTEENIRRGSSVALLIATRETVEPGRAGIGFRITGEGTFHYSGPEYEAVATRFSSARAALMVTIEKIDRLI